MTRHAEYLAGLLCAGILAATPWPATMPLPTATSFVYSIGTMLYRGYDYQSLLLPSGIETLAATGACKHRLRFHFRGYDLSRPYSLQPLGMGLTGASVDLPLVALFSQQDLNECSEQELEAYAAQRRAAQAIPIKQ
jgi:hypothetical protein